MRILSGHWKLSVIERSSYREVRLYLYPRPPPPPPLSIFLYEPTTANEQVPRITALSSVEGGMASPLKCSAIHGSHPEPNLYLFTALVNSKLVWDS